MLNSNTFIRTAGICGLLGNIFVLASFAIGILFPNNQLPSAPFYATGGILLLIHVVGLLVGRQGRPRSLSIVSLAGGILGLATIAFVGIADTLSRVGIGSLNGDDYWPVFIVALLLTFLSLSVYAFTAWAGKVFPRLMVLPLGVVGVALLLSVPFSILTEQDTASALSSFADTLSLVLMIAFFAAWGLMSAAGLRNSFSGTQTPAGLSPHRPIPT